jgi:PKD domain
VLAAVPALAAANAPPTADFYFFPKEPKIGETVDFVSASSDPDGRLVEQLWDLDGDGQYDDGAGEHVTWVYYESGFRTVGIRVRDDGGLTALVRKDLTALPLTPPPPPPPTLMSPFPVIRISGGMTRTGARIRRLAVRSPRGARVTVRCRGRGCPRRRQSTISDGRARFHRFERRYRAGVVLAVFVTQPNRIGKYTRFRIRRGKSPARLDRCLQPGSTTPSRCPST